MSMPWRRWLEQSSLSMRILHAKEVPRYWVWLALHISTSDLVGKDDNLALILHSMELGTIG